MKNKKRNIIIIILCIILTVIALYVSGVIAKPIAKICAIHYVENNFPEMKLEFVDIEWSKYHNAYIVKFKDKDNEIYSFTMEKYFPSTPGQGLFELEETYRKKYVEKDEQESYADVFYATIEKITQYNGKTVLLVKGLEVNDINHRGEYDFSIDEDTKLEWRYTEIDVSKLKVGQNISITFTGDVLESYPARLKKVTKVIVLSDEI